ncbi:hypothetical protein UY3_17856 [Chelonia mydas]|uniref:Uncharacterized protein n=1 Tax=Chelonia mydas TaxID=8469 RepID=M7AQS4_CHEMY|nr:hypothetical protein UY3_17856 [Chelonia mydas]
MFLLFLDLSQAAEAPQYATYGLPVSGQLYQFCRPKQLPPNCRHCNSSRAAAELPPWREEQRSCHLIAAAGHGLPPHSKCRPKHLLGKLVPGAGPDLYTSLNLILENLIALAEPSYGILVHAHRKFLYCILKPVLLKLKQSNRNVIAANALKAFTGCGPNTLETNDCQEQDTVQLYGKQTAEFTASSSETGF